jgi:hypothetical protein
MRTEHSTAQKSGWTPQAIVLAALPVLLLVLLGISIARREYAEPLFIHTTYYFLLVTVACWAGVYLHQAKDLNRSVVWAWIKENRIGVFLAILVTVVAAATIHPALRVLSDETNLLGTSKNFFANKVATFTTTGKYYYDNFWDSGVVIDRRPSLFPFLVSLIHVVRGYSYTNVFLFNLILLPVFVLVAYRIAKRLGGEVFGVLAAMFVVAHPITLISVRSGGFDFMAVLLTLLIFHSFLDHCMDPSPGRQAILWMNLCVFAESRYETALFVPPAIGVMLLFRLLRLGHIKPFALVYALTPAYLLPRIWQSILRGNVPEQDPGTITFSLGNFLENTRDYFKPIFSPFNFHPPHAAIVIGLGVLGTVMAFSWYDRRLLAKDWKRPTVKFGTMVLVWMVLQMVIVFTYFWGRALHPASARLVIIFDTFFAFPAAWFLTVVLKRFRPYVSFIAGVAVLCVYLPVASQYRMLNELTLTREAATTWRFFESLHEERILIVCDRPGLYTVMNYGAVDFEAARQDPTLLDSLSRRLFYDIYLIQQIDLTSKAPLPQYEIWPERPRQTLLEFQNDANATVRISRLLR